jgi:poly(A) polymerase
MEVLGLGPGPEIGEALAYLMELRLERGPITSDEAIELLKDWFADRPRA